MTETKKVYGWFYQRASLSTFTVKTNKSYHPHQAKDNSQRSLSGTRDLSDFSFQAITPQSPRIVILNYYVIYWKNIRNNLEGVLFFKNMWHYSAWLDDYLKNLSETCCTFNILVWVKDFTALIFDGLTFIAFFNIHKREIELLPTKQAGKSIRIFFFWLHFSSRVNSVVKKVTCLWR